MQANVFVLLLLFSYFSFTEVCGFTVPVRAPAGLLVRVGPARDAHPWLRTVGRGQQRRPGGARVSLLSICMKAQPDYYKVLGVDKKADVATIKRAYKKLAMKNHPDVNKEAGAKDRFILINEAYAVLSDPEKRRKYDFTSSNPFSGWSSSSSSSSSSSWGSRNTGGGFDTDEFWSRYKSKEETTKDIDDSFEAIFSDLFKGVKGSSQRAREKSSLIDDFGDFLEALLGKEGITEDDQDEVLDDDEETLRLEIKDAKYVLEQLEERSRRLSEDASKADSMASEWKKKSDAPSMDPAVARAAKEKVSSFTNSAQRFRERSKKVAEMANKQKKKIERMEEKLSGGSGKAAASAGEKDDGKTVVSCPKCSQKLRVPARVSGMAKCPACSYEWERVVEVVGRKEGGKQEAKVKEERKGKEEVSGKEEVKAGSKQEEVTARVVVSCPSCSQRLRVPKGKRGTVACPSCGKKFESDGEEKKQPSGSAPPSGRTWRDGPEDELGRWAAEQKMRQDLAKAKVEKELEELKNNLGL